MKGVVSAESLNIKLLIDDQADTVELILGPFMNSYLPPIMDNSLEADKHKSKSKMSEDATFNLLAIKSIKN